MGEFIETKRLLLRCWQEEDAEELYKLCLDQRLRLSGVSSYRNIEESRNTIRSWKQNPEMRAIMLFYFERRMDGTSDKESLKRFSSALISAFGLYYPIK